jgi:hypothetical protein
MASLQARGCGRFSRLLVVQVGQRTAHASDRILRGGARPYEARWRLSSREWARSAPARLLSLALHPNLDRLGWRGEEFAPKLGARPPLLREYAPLECEDCRTLRERERVDAHVVRRKRLER